MVRNSAHTNPHRRAKKVQMSAAPFGVHQSAPCPAPAADTDLPWDGPRGGANLPSLARRNRSVPFDSSLTRKILVRARENAGGRRKGDGRPPGSRNRPVLVHALLRLPTRSNGCCCVCARLAPVPCCRTANTAQAETATSPNRSPPTRGLFFRLVQGAAFGQLAYRLPTSNRKEKTPLPH